MSTPKPARKRKSSEMGDEPTTPKTSPVKRLKMSQSHKQALIENLQLELTEKSRQMRAHYALQCADLRSRIERRVNRVPIHMRKMKMGQLLEQHQKAACDAANPPPSQSILAAQSSKSQTRAQGRERPLPALPTKARSPQKLYSSSSPAKQRKRKSSTMQFSDKENNEPSSSTSGFDVLPVQKNTKRVKTTTKAAPVSSTTAASSQQPKRPASRAQKKPTKAAENPNGVLSPRSNNTQALPKTANSEKDRLPPRAVREETPVRAQSPIRPTSPSKPQSPFKAAMTGLSAFAKRSYAAAGAAGARLTRPLSREKEQANLSGMATASVDNLASSTNRMLPPPRPLTAMSTMNASAATIIPISPQRTASQASMHSQTSQQSSTSTNGTVVTKPTKSTMSKKNGVAAKSTVSRSATTTTTTAASRAKGKIVVSSSTASTLSPKGSKTAPPRPATAASKRALTTSTMKKPGTAGATTGRVLRKRN